MPMKGNASIDVELQVPGDDTKYPMISKNCGMVRLSLFEDTLLHEEIYFTQICLLFWYLGCFGCFQVHGRFSFNVPMEEIREVLGDDIADTDVYVHANVYDWYGIETQSYSGYAKIISSVPQMRFLGGKIRTFKPGHFLNVHVSGV